MRREQGVGERKRILSRPLQPSAVQIKDHKLIKGHKLTRPQHDGCPLAHKRVDGGKALDDLAIDKG